MFKKVALATLVFICSCLRSGAQDIDSAWYYANILTDYATADLVCLVRVGQTKISETTGGYTLQEVTFEPVNFFKGQTRQRKFNAWVENHEVVWKPGTVHGFYLLKEDQEPAKEPGQDTEMYYWLENAGFAAKDTSWLVGIADTVHLKKMVAQYILPDIGGAWANVTLVALDREQNQAAGPVNAVIRLDKDVPALNLKKGQEVPVVIWRDAYMTPEELYVRFEKKGSWDVVLTMEEGLLHMKTTFMLER